VSVVAARLLVACVVIDERIHVPPCHTKEHCGLSEFGESVRIVPIGLVEDPYAKPMVFEETPNQRHAETRMIHVGVAGHEDDVAGFPTEGVHLRARSRQKGRSAEALRPKRTTREKSGRSGFDGAWGEGSHGSAQL